MTTTTSTQKRRTEPSRLGEQSYRDNYLFTNKMTLQEETYVFTVNSYHPRDGAESAASKLQSALTAAILRTLARSRGQMLHSTSKCHAATGAERR